MIGKPGVIDWNVIEPALHPFEYSLCSVRHISAGDTDCTPQNPAFMDGGVPEQGPPPFAYNWIRKIGESRSRKASAD
jgi:hypothetical protein